MTRVIEVSLTDLEERILEILSRKSLGLTANQISIYLETSGLPLSSWQVRDVLRDMNRLGLISRERSGHKYRYSFLGKPAWRLSH